MPKKADPSRLVGSWLHSFEEDGEDFAVFRPSHADLPPARGRPGIVMKADGTAGRTWAGADDRTAAASGSWTLDKSGMLTLPDGLPGIDGTIFKAERRGEKLVLKPVVAPDKRD